MRSWGVSWTLWFLLLALLAALPQSALALTASQVYEQVKDSVVVVKAYDQKGKPVGLGSGVMLPSGDIITNYHVVEAGMRYTVGRGKHTVPASPKAGDADKDICLLISSGLVTKPARLGQSAILKVGEPVYAVGAPQGLELSLSEGIVSQLRGGGPHPIIQTTVAISRGSSGGGLFNAKGELVGITTFYLKGGQSLNFALPVEWIGEIATRKNKEGPIVEAPEALTPRARAQSGCLDHAKALEKALDWPGLLDWCRRWTQAEPGNYLTWSWLGVAYNRLGRHREAIAAYREALRLKPDDAHAWYHLGGEYFCLQRHQETIAAYLEALRLEPDSNAWYFLGWAYAELGRYREAIKAWREGLRLKPDDADALYDVGYGLALSGNRSAALEAAKELRPYNPEKADELFNLIMKP